MYWHDGSIYKGDWYQGIQHGVGSITLKDGKVKKGQFENGQYIGKIQDENERQMMKTPLEPLYEDDREDMAEQQDQPFKDGLVDQKSDPSQKPMPVGPIGDE